MSVFSLIDYKSQILLLCSKKKNTNLLFVGLIIILGLLIIWFVWHFYDLQIKAIDDNIRKVKAE